MARVDYGDYEDDLLYGDDVEVSEPEEIESDDQNNYSEQEYEEEDEQSEDNVMYDYLMSKGINPEAVKIETENGIEEINFNDLSREEQLSILGDNPQDDYRDADDLTDDEVALINQIRKNNWSTQDYNNYIAQQAYNQFMSQQQEQYSVDDFSDEELFLADLQTKIPDLTEDEAVQELTNAKDNEELFEKKIKALREEYKAREDEDRQQQQQEQENAYNQQMQQVTDTILNTIEQNREMDLGGQIIEMSDDDMNAVASFILDSDQAGVRHIQKALNDPQAVVQMAWWLTRGREAFRTLNDYYKNQITQVARNNYQRGLQDAGQKPKSIVRQKKGSSQQQNTGLLDDLI